MFPAWAGRLARWVGLEREDYGVLILEDSRSGRKLQFSLWDGGRVNVSLVENATGVSPVMYQNSDGNHGIYVCLEAGDGGLSRQRFQPGETILLDHHPAPLHGWAPPPILDLDYTDVSRDLIKETAEVFNVCGYVFLWSELKDPDAPVTRTEDAQMMLLKRERGEDPENDWDERCHPEQHKEHMELVMRWLRLPSDSSFGWATKEERQGLHKDFMNDFSIKNKNDELLVETSLGVKGAVLGMDMVKRLTWRGWYRSQLNFFLVAFTSQLPYVQLYTDMETGGMVYICRDAEGDHSLLWKIVLENMDEVQEFVELFGKSLPRSLKDFTKEQLVEFEALDDPPRAVFPYPGCKCLVPPPRHRILVM